MSRSTHSIKVGNKTYKLRLTVGATETIEEELGLQSYAEIPAILQSPKVRQLRVIFRALTEGGGTPMSDEEVRNLDLVGFREDIVAAITAAMPEPSEDEAEGGETEGDGPEKK